MAEEKQLYNFGEWVTSSEEIAEIFYYIKQIEIHSSFLSSENVVGLVERQSAISGCVFRIKSALTRFLAKEYQVKVDDVVAETYAFKILEMLDNLTNIVFYFQEVALALPIETLQDNLQKVALEIQGLPKMVAALDAGEDEVK